MMKWEKYFTTCHGVYSTDCRKLIREELLSGWQTPVSKSSNSIKCGEIVDWLRNCQLLKDSAPYGWLVR
jgi:hypothetical protein